MKLSSEIIEKIEPRSFKNQKEKFEMLNIIHKWPDLMENIGLTKYESKVYLTLLVLGPTNARNICKYSDVPRTKVYSVLKKLSESHLVIEAPASPKLFMAISPEEAFDMKYDLMKNKVINFESLMNRLNEIHSRVKRNKRIHRKIIWCFNNYRDIYKKLKDIIKKTKNSILVVTNEAGVSMLFNDYNKLLDELQESGIDVKVFSPLNPKTSYLARELSYIFDVEMKKVETPVFQVVSDQRRLLLAKITTQNERKNFESAIYVDDISLLSILSLMIFIGDKKNLLLYT